MPLRAVFAIALILSAAAAHAQSSGELNAELGGETTLFTILPDSVDLSETSGFRTLLLSGAAEDGQTLTLLFGPWQGDALPDRVKIEWRAGDRAFAANADTGGALAASGIETADGALTAFSFGGLVVPAEVIPGGAMAPIEAAQGIEIDGSFTGRIPLN